MYLHEMKKIFFINYMYVHLSNYTGCTYITLYILYTYKYIAHRCACTENRLNARTPTYCGGKGTVGNPAFKPPCHIVA
jgi:hypothetical protein